MLNRFASILILVPLSFGCASMKKAVPTANTCNYEPYLITCTQVCTTNKAGCTVCTCAPNRDRAELGIIQERSP